MAGGGPIVSEGGPIGATGGGVRLRPCSGGVSWALLLLLFSQKKKKKICEKYRVLKEPWRSLKLYQYLGVFNQEKAP